MKRVIVGSHTKDFELRDKITSTFMKICKDCKKEVVCNYLKLDKHSRQIFLDDKGRQWKNKSCPDCANLKRKNRRRVLKQEIV